MFHFVDIDARIRSDSVDSGMDLARLVRSRICERPRLRLLDQMGVSA